MVIMCRSMKAGTTAVRAIKLERPQAEVQCMQCDLCNLTSVYQCAQSYKAKEW